MSRIDVNMHTFPNREQAAKLAQVLIERGVQFAYEPRENCISYPTAALPPEPVEISYES